MIPERIWTTGTDDSGSWNAAPTSLGRYAPETEYVRADINDMMRRDRQNAIDAQADRIAELEAKLAELEESGATLYAELYRTRERVFHAASLLDTRIWEPVGIISREWAQLVSNFLDEVGYND